MFAFVPSFRAVVLLALVAACNSPDTASTPAASGADAPPFVPATGPTADPAAASPGAEAGPAQASKPATPSAPAASTPSTVDSARFLLSPGRVGALRLNMSETALLEAVPYEQLRETTRTVEGIRYPAYEWPDRQQPQAPPLLLEMVGDSAEGYRLWRVQVRDPRYRTAAGIGVGSPFGAAVQQYGVSTIERTDAGLVAVSDQARMSWVLDEKSVPAARRGTVRAADVPPATRITGVLLFR